MQRIPGEVVVCPAKFKDENSRMAMGQMAIKNALKKAAPSTKKAATAELLITFGPGAEGNAAVQEAFQFALDIWSEEIVSSEPIRIFADFADLGAGVLASAGPTTLISNFPGAPQADVFYPIALANSLAGEDLAPDLEFDLVVNIGNGIPWYFGTDGNTPAGQFDFVTVALHEAGHGLGFVDGGTVNNNTGVGNINNGGNPFVFDTFIVDGAGNSVLDLPNPSVALGDFLTSGDVFVNGEFAVAALGGILPELFAPNPFQGGSSIAHWDEATFPAGDPNSLMSPQVGTAESNFDIGDITRGHFRDMGWVLAEQAPFNITPGIFSVELNVEETATQEVTITNVSEGPITLSSFTSVGAQIIQGSDPAEFTLGVGESTSVTINLSTVGVPAGLSEESIIFAAEGFDVTDDVTFNFRVLDGTEAPIISVDPVAFDETIEQFMVETRDLVINNTGNDDLNFTISVGDNALPNFQSRAIATFNNIQANGVTKQKVASAAKANSLTSLLTIDGTINKIVSNLFAEDFENLAPGDINGQAGWFGRFENNWAVSTANAFEGGQHLRAVSDGLGGTRPAIPLALSPTFITGDQPFSVMSAQVNIEGSGVSWEIIPQNTVVGSVVTRLRFNGDGTIDVLDGGVGGFVPVNAAIPEGYFEVRIVIDRDTAGLRIFFDGELVHSGAGFATSIDNVALLSDMAVEGSTMDIDNLDVTDGDEDAFFLAVAPISGVVPFDSSLTATVTFDGRLLEPGTVNAVITINSNDPDTPSIDVPVTLTVVSPPTITVDPDSISASVDVTVDNPPVANSSFTISNSGQSPLEFTTSLGPTSFTAADDPNAELLQQLDRTLYGLGSNFSGTVKAAGTPGYQKVSFDKTLLSNATAVTDSIFYDSGVEFPGDFVGLGDGAPGISTAIQFDVVNQDFALTAIRNSYRTEGLSNVAVLLQVFTGGASPAEGELLLEQVITGDSPNGVVALEVLNTPLQFSVGESFWVVHSYPQGISFPQGVDDTITTTRPNTYAFSSNGGATYTNLDGFAFLTRALSDGSGAFIELSPRTGTVAPGESLEVSVSFDGSTLPNGIHQTDISVDSNDPINPSVTVATSFEVSGQVAGIDVSDELLLFNDVFVGAESQRTFTISSTGVDNLNISSITSDNPDFTVSPESAVVSSGEELEVSVTFAPSEKGTSNGIISIVSNANPNDPIQVVVNGVGVGAPFAVLDPEQVSETVVEGKVLETSITLKNEGESPLTFSFPEFTVAAALADPNIPMQVSEVLPFEGFSLVQQKGFSDSRIGAPVELSMGTDLGSGYTWIDSDEEGGPVNNFFDISAFGFELTDFLVDANGFGDGTVSLTLPFAFEFYGVEYTQLFINANGFVSFQLPEGLTFINRQIPVADGIDNIIAPLWADLEPQEGGAVHILGFSDAVILQWTNSPAFSFGGDTGTVTFQMILFDDGTVDVYYADVSSANFLESATVGIENADGSDGAQVAFNSPYLKDGLALRFIAPDILLTPFITDVAPVSGVVPAFGETEIAVTLDATNLEPGVFFDELRVSSNSPDMSRSTALFELTVIEGPRVTGFTLYDADADQPIGPLVDGAVLDLADFPLGTNFNIEATVGSVPVGSVVFDFNGDPNFRTESKAPFALGGDSNGNFRALDLPLGVNTLNATPFTLSGGNGESGLANAISFEVIRSEANPISLALINADTDTTIGILEDGATINLADFPAGTNFNVEAVVDGISVGSVSFDFNGQSPFRVENVAPYALGGDSGGNFRALNLPIGANTVTANGFSLRNAQGAIIASTTVSFEVVDIPLEESSDIRVFPNSSSDIVNVAFKDDRTGKLTGTLFNMFGQLVRSNLVFDLESSNAGTFSIATLPQGIYILELRDDKGQAISQSKIIRR